jgi:hypothetical protein
VRLRNTDHKSRRTEGRSRGGTVDLSKRFREVISTTLQGGLHAAAPAAGSGRHQNYYPVLMGPQEPRKPTVATIPPYLIMGMPEVRSLSSVRGKDAGSWMTCAHRPGQFLGPLRRRRFDRYRQIPSTNSPKVTPRRNARGLRSLTHNYLSAVPAG